MIETIDVRFEKYLLIYFINRARILNAGVDPFLQDLLYIVQNHVELLSLYTGMVDKIKELSQLQLTNIRLAMKELQLDRNIPLSETQIRLLELLNEITVVEKMVDTLG